MRKNASTSDPATLRRRATVAIKALCPAFVTQRKLERVLGLSPGYLSRLRAGGRTPGAVLVNVLALVAADPVCRLNELACFWAAPSHLHPSEVPDVRA